MSNNLIPSTSTSSISPSTSRKKHKSSNALTDSINRIDIEFICPICLDFLEEAQVTKCGHTFCCKCITESLSENNNRCPQCSYFVEQFFPNYLLNELALKYKRMKTMENELTKTQPGNRLNDVQKIVLEKSEELDTDEIDQLLNILNQRKKHLEKKAQIDQNELLKEFLQKLSTRKHEQFKLLQVEISQIDNDYEMLIKNSPTINDEPMTHSNNHNNDSQTSIDPSNHAFNSKSFGNCMHTNNDISASIEMKRKKINFHFDDLEKCYLSYCKKDNFGGHNYIDNDYELSLKRLTEFSRDLNQFTRYTDIRPLAILNFSTESLSSSSHLISSIEFDKDNEFFAITGVIKKIRIFDYSSVIKDSIGNCYPIIDIDCASKISCLNWNSYHKAMMATSDYDGSVIVWDAFLGQHLNQFQEHEKRCWGVDFNKIDHNIIASGSDDCTVKLWSINTQSSIRTLQIKANVCSVRFNPQKLYYLAFSSADHNVYYYDLRQTKEPLFLYRGHSKAVSLIRFLNENELISSSIDSQIKLWSTRHSNCMKTYHGHLNEKHFVGLTTNDDFIACGSENNTFSVYYKGIERQMLNYSFNIKSPEKEDVNEFCSSICWRKSSNVIVAANSQGIIMILELI